MRILIIPAVGLLATMLQAWAVGADLKPSQIFAADSPSIVVVMAYGEDGKAIAQGSGVVIAKDTVVSNCHVVEKANSASVLYQNKRFAATLRYEDVEHDLCSFTVQGLNAPPVRMGSTSEVQVGDTAYAIGAPEGLELTLSGGLISSLRRIPDGVVLQMTTPISPGSSGGGLFDSEGRLIGITSYYMAKGEQLNFALPVEWIRELPRRGKLAATTTSHTAQSSNVDWSAFTPIPAPTTSHTAQSSNAAPTSGLQNGERALLAGGYRTALALLKPLAVQGNPVAQNLVGVMYDNGQGVPQDYAQAVVWFRKAATQGFAVAEDNLGLMYYKGQGVPQDYAQAVAWYRKAAEQANADAQNSLGWMYDNGQGVPQDYSQAVAWYRKAAEQANADAQNNLGAMYVEGQGVPQDYSKAAAWYRKAAEQGVAFAQYNLGVMYDQGQGVPQDYARALAWYRKAAAQGDARAQYNLGVMYHNGQGVPQDFVAAYALYNLSATLDSSGDNPAAINRNKLMNSMTPAQVTAGQALTREMQSIGVIKALDEYTGRTQ